MGCEAGAGTRRAAGLEEAEEEILGFLLGFLKSCSSAGLEEAEEEILGRFQKTVLRREHKPTHSQHHVI